MNLFLAIGVVVGFAAILELLALPASARDVGQRGKNCLKVLRDNSLSDREKEEILQKQAGQLFGLLGVLAGGSALALGGPLAVVWLLEQVGLGTFSTVLGILQRVDFLLGTVVAGGLAYVLVSQLRTA